MKNIDNKLIAIVSIQIFLLLVLTPANSFFIKQSLAPETQTQAVTSNSNPAKDNNFLSGISGFLGWLFTIKQIGDVSATSTSNAYWCCKSTCTNITVGSTSGGGCDSIEGISQTSCNQVPDCETGTCIDSSAGTCSANIAKSICKNNGETWSTGNLNSVPSCQYLCCNLGDGVESWMRNVTCSSQGGSVESGITQQKLCGLTQNMGACVKPDKGCIFTTQEDCIGNNKGAFYQGDLCTNPSLNTTCLPTNSTKCYNNNVYFVDNCGNPANVYDYSKTIANVSNLADPNWAYWNKTITDNSKLCSSSSNVKGCGLCNYPDSSICSAYNPSADSSSEKPESGNYFCRSLTCDMSGNNYFPSSELGNTKIANNTESWCIYEGHVGGISSSSGNYSSDAVGSYSAKQYCDQGVIKLDTGLGGNNEYRMYICGENITGNEVYALNRPNTGLSCISVKMDQYKYDNNGNVIDGSKILQQNEAACGNASKGGGSDCRLQSVNLATNKDNNFRFDVCVPKYPPGFDLNPASNTQSDTSATNVMEANSEVCGLASQNCTTIWRKSLLSGWRCIKNCECLTQDFANQMNDLCVSLGDCGGYVNINGAYSASYNSYDGSLPSNYQKSGQAWFNEPYSVTANGKITDTLEKEYSSGISKSNSITGSSANIPWPLSSAQLAQYGGENPISTTAAKGGDISNIVDGVSSGAAWVTTFIITLVIANSWNAVGWALTIAAAVAAAVNLLLGWIKVGKTEPYVVNFQCSPWQPPMGVSSDTCKKCGTFGLPCTQYQCESLGEACELLNISDYGTPNPTCVKQNTNPPDIKFLRVQEGDKNLTINSHTQTISPSGGGCFNESSLLNFSLETIDPTKGNKEIAKCAWNYTHFELPAGWDPPVDFSSPSLDVNTFVQGDYPSRIWNFSARLPFVAQLPTSDVTGSTPGKRTGNVSIYTMCESLDGVPNIQTVYQIKTCIKESPDTQEAQIYTYDPTNGSYLPYGVNQSLLHITLSKPANCSWSLGEDKLYSDMTPMNPSSGSGNLCIYNSQNLFSGGDCYANLTGLNQSENDIYIKCKTHPWDNTGVVNQQGFLYVLKQTQNPLDINSINVIKSSGESTALDITNYNPVTINEGGPNCALDVNNCLFNFKLDVQTSGGSDDGNSNCNFEIIQPSKFAGAGDTMSSDSTGTDHQYTLTLPEDNYKIAVNCTDANVPGNKASQTAVFNLALDTTPPVVTRISKSSSAITVTTDENAKCYYSTVGCNFDISGSESHSMDGGTSSVFELSHEISYQKGTTYYVKCTDEWGNTNSGCSTITSSSY